MKGLRTLVIAVLLLAALAWGVLAYRNPERQRIDDAARTGAAGIVVETGIGKTYYEAAGPADGRVVVLVHGFSVPSYIWDPTFAALAADGKRVIRYDLFGRGRSDRPDGTYDGAFYDAQLDALLAALHVTQPVDLVGLSFGGFVVAHYAAGHPTRVRTLTLVDVVTRAGTPAWYIAAPLIGPYLFQVLAVPGMADGQPSDFLHPEKFPDWVDRYKPQMRYYGFGRALRRSSLAVGRRLRCLLRRHRAGGHSRADRVGAPRPDDPHRGRGERSPTDSDSRVLRRGGRGASATPRAAGRFRPQAARLPGAHGARRRAAVTGWLRVGRPRAPSGRRDYVANPAGILVSP